jgi:hypothetical protein
MGMVVESLKFGSLLILNQMLQKPFFEPNHNASKNFTATRKTLVYQDKALNKQSNVLDAQPSLEHIVFS